MESVDDQKSGAPPYPDLETNAASEWHSISVGESKRSETECCLLLTGSEQMIQPSTKLDLSISGLSDLVGKSAEDESDPSKMDCRYVSIKASEIYSGMKEVRVSFDGLEDPKKCSESVGCSDDGCLPLLQHVRAFIKGAKLSCTGLLSGDVSSFYGWSSLLQRSCSSKPSGTSSFEFESFCKKGISIALGKTTFAPTPATSIPSTTSSLQARDPASQAEALPLAHYRPTDGALWKEGDAAKQGLSTAATSPSKLPVNCKKPPKPPKHPRRSASLDSATMGAQRAARKNRDRASTKRKSKGGAASAAGSTSLTPLVALMLMILFGVLIVFQGVFVQTNVMYGRSTDGGFRDDGANARSSLPTDKAVLLDRLHLMDPHLSAPLNVDVRKSEVLLSGSLQKSMTDLPWTRSSLVSQIKSTSSTG